MAPGGDGALAGLDRPADLRAKLWAGQWEGAFRGCAIAPLHFLALGLRKGALPYVQALLALSVVDVYERVPNKSDADACLKALDALHRREVHAHRLQQSVCVDTHNVVSEPLLILLSFSSTLPRAKLAKGPRVLRPGLHCRHLASNQRALADT